MSRSQNLTIEAQPTTTPDLHGNTPLAVSRLTFVGTLVPWSNFLRSVENAHTTQNWPKRSRTSPYNNGPHTLEVDKVHIGDEHGLQGRFQQAIGHALGTALESRSIDIYFGDYKCSGSTYQNIPDIVGLQDANGTTEIKLVGELKTPWVHGHDLIVATAKQSELRRKIAQPMRDIQQLNCEYGFISTYEDTIFLRQFRSPGGGWEVWYSQPISSSGYYVPTVPYPQAIHLALPQVSMKMCMFYVCSSASTSPPVYNQTKGS
ncbi:hypothetical protein PENSOL_c003G11771 [Penicillium solitum]|uniref:Uncharacterized protein n=1 Tax=Penicillium solitum TaxID=60172 RepID=A0A1V6RKL5_9EURO|nr:uncharacterized protein PENSOL_c003G11771 [Penicillium solitum]OQE01913.1 hypothetical protein PENSOL_c003G11771 [Penicillium solitum]